MTIAKCASFVQSEAATAAEKIDIQRRSVLKFLLYTSSIANNFSNKDLVARGRGKASKSMGDTGITFEWAKLYDSTQSQVRIPFGESEGFAIAVMQDGAVNVTLLPKGKVQKESYHGFNLGSIYKTSVANGLNELTHGFPQDNGGANKYVVSGLLGGLDKDTFYWYLDEVYVSLSKHGLISEQGEFSEIAFDTLFCSEESPLLVEP